MILTAGLYAFTVLLVLASLIRSEYKRLRRLQPAPYGLDPQAAEDPKAAAPAGKRSERVAAALRTWSSGRTTSDAESPLRHSLLERSPKAPVPAEEVTMPESRLEPGPTMEPEAAGPTAAEEAEPPVPEAIAPQWSQPRPIESQPADPDPAPAQPARAQPRRAEETPAAPAAEFTSRQKEEIAPPPNMPLSQNADYYEVLQISPNADPETIHRVYRIMASRFHPDNPTTGNLERFLQLREAYQTLSDSALRNDYDATHRRQQIEPLPVFWRRAFVDGIEGEMNRRLGVLSLLYARRRTCDTNPGVSVLELERRMAFPREYLNFTLWYLRSKGYIMLMEDNSDYALTGTGVDYVESRSTTNRVIRELLNAGSNTERPNRRRPRRAAKRLPRQSEPSFERIAEPEAPGQIDWLT